MNRDHDRRRSRLGLLLSLALVAMSFTACDSDKTGRGLNTGQPSPQFNVNGVAVAGAPLDGATVRAFQVSNGRRGAALGESQTGSDGKFGLLFDKNNDPAYTGPVLITVAGGTYTDPATGQTVTLTDDLEVFVPDSTADNELKKASPMHVGTLQQ